MLSTFARLADDCHLGVLGGFDERIVESGKRRLYSLGKFEIGRVVDAQIVSPGQFENGGLGGRVVEGEGEDRQSGEEGGRVPWGQSLTALAHEKDVA